MLDVTSQLKDTKVLHWQKRANAIKSIKNIFVGVADFIQNDPDVI